MAVQLGFWQAPKSFQCDEFMFAPFMRPDRGSHPAILHTRTSRVSAAAVRTAAEAHIYNVKDDELNFELTSLDSEQPTSWSCSHQQLQLSLNY